MKNPKNKLRIVTIIIILFAIILIATGIISIKGNSTNTKVNTKKEILTETKELIIKVKKDDTLEKIAKKYNIEKDVIKKMNLLTEDDLKNVTEIKIPGVTKYKIKDKDTMKTISNKFYISENQIMMANNLKTNDISKEKYIILPNTFVHVMKKGETIDSISTKYNLEKVAIIQYNKLETEQTSENDIIVLPKKIFNDKENANSTKRTLEAINNSEKLMEFAKEIYDKKKYQNYKKENSTYVMTIKDAEKEGYNITKYICNYKDDDEVMIFEPSKEGEQTPYPIIIKNKCFGNIK